jgi:biotin carboxyl carrier protein
LVKDGASISQGETILILEVMKMEIRVESPHSGRAVEIRVKEGDSIQQDVIVAAIE